MVIIYLGILTVSCFRFSKFPLNFYLKNNVIFFFLLLALFSLCLSVSPSVCLSFPPGTQSLGSYIPLYCGKTIYLKEDWILKHPSTHIHSFWIIYFSGRFVLMLMFIFIHTFSSQVSFCVDIGLVSNIHLSYISMSSEIAGGSYGELPGPLESRWIASPLDHLLKTNIFMEIFFKSLKLFMNRILVVLSGNTWNKTRVFFYFPTTF